jgi:hypothetical protein
MLNDQELTLRQRKPSSAAGKRLQLLMVADSANHLEELITALGGQGVGITAVVLPADPPDLHADLHDLAVIDVSPTKLKELLMNFRQPGKARELPLLVAARSVSAAPELLGVLPQFRAMACGPAEMRSLIRHYLNGAGENRNRRLLL